MERKMSTKGMILDINSMRSRVSQIKNVENDLLQLIKTLTEKDYYNDESISTPSLKEISSEIGFSYNKTNRLIQKLYSKIVLDEDFQNNPFTCEKTKICFCVRGLYNSKTFYFKELATIPREGESISLPFFKEFIGTYYFYVSKIVHEFYDNEQHICVWLETGSLNKYWEIRKDQAEFTGEIPTGDILFKTDIELKEKLGIKPIRAW